VSFEFSESLKACDLCGSDDLIQRAPEARIMECRGCGYRFVNPRPSQDEIAESYSTPAKYDGWLSDEEGRQVMWRKRWQTVKRYATGNRLVDVGAGIGTFLAYAQDDGWDVTGTEVSTSAIELARSRYGLELAKGQLEDLFIDGQFDVVTLWHVLEHIPSPSRGLELCRGLLRPGGLLVIAVPNDADERARLQTAKNRQHYRRYEELRKGNEIHLSHFTVGVLRDALSARGFRLRLATVDDHYATPTPRSDRLVRAYRLLMSGTGLNLGFATLILANKS
jgi:SAM-dependent methyltransferase